jgi:hypothetical protein
MENPFERIEKRLQIIEGLLLDIKHQRVSQAREEVALLNSDTKCLTFRQAIEMATSRIPPRFYDMLVHSNSLDLPVDTYAASTLETWHGVGKTAILEFQEATGVKFYY